MKKHSFLLLVLAIALIFGACGNPTGNDTKSGNPRTNPGNNPGGNTVQRVPASFSASKSGVSYTLTITPPSNKAARAVMVGDDYRLTISSSSATKVSAGKVSSIAGSVFTLKPSSDSAPTFTAAFKDAAITAVTGTITFDDGTSEKGPGSLTSSSGGGGGGGGGSPPSTSTPPSNPTNPPQPSSHLHNWGAWTQTTAPTCTTAGMETRTCTADASHKETRSIAIDPNAHNWETLSGTPATCTTTGSGVRKCKLCSKEETNGILVIDINAHDWGDWLEKAAATCTTAKVEESKCRHNPSHTQEQYVGTALGHNWGNWTQTIAPSTTEVGEKTRTCQRCDQKETQQVDKLPAPSTAGIIFSVEQITEGAPMFTYITISRTSTGYPVTYPVSVTASDYESGSISWEVAGVGIYSNQTVTGSSASFTLNAADVRYNSLGGHNLKLTVKKNGKQYQRTIPFTIVQ